MSKSPAAPLSGLMVPAKGEAAVPEVAPATVAPPIAPERAYRPRQREVRHGLTIRVLDEHMELLDTMATMEHRTKQSLLDQAIAEFLVRTGYSRRG
jgi:hypothetical protein